MTRSALSENQRKLLPAIQFNAGCSVEEASRASGLSRGAVRYALRTLIDRRIIRPLVCVDISLLGHTDFCFYYSMSFPDERSRRKMLEYLAASPRVTWLSELAGRYQYTMALYGKSLAEVGRFLDDVAEASGGSFLEKSLATRVTWSLFPAKFLSKDARTGDGFTAGAENRTAKIDDVDHRILAFLCRTNEIRPALVARALRMPVTTIHYRLDRLKREGIIRNYSYRLDLDACRFRRFRLIATTRHSGKDVSRRLYAFCAKHPNITCFVSCLGNWDFEITVDVEHADELPPIVQQISQAFEREIGSIELLSVLKNRKACLYPFAVP